MLSLLVMNTIVFTLRMPKEIHTQLSDAAWKNRTSMNKLANEILRDYFEKSIKAKKDVIWEK